MANADALLQLLADEFARDPTQTEAIITRARARAQATHFRPDAGENATSAAPGGTGSSLETPSAVARRPSVKVAPNTTTGTGVLRLRRRRSSIASVEALAAGLAVDDALVSLERPLFSSSTATATAPTLPSTLKGARQMARALLDALHHSAQTGAQVDERINAWALSFGLFDPQVMQSFHQRRKQLSRDSNGRISLNASAELAALLPAGGFSADAPTLPAPLVLVLVRELVGDVVTLKPVGFLQGPCFQMLIPRLILAYYIALRHASTGSLQNGAWLRGWSSACSLRMSTS